MSLAFGGREVGDLSVDYSVDVDVRSGASGLSVSVPASPGRSGLGPALTLRYSSGSGNSAFGAGWALEGLPVIAIDTRRCVPRWDGSDGYQLSGDELVPWLERKDDAWVPRGFTDGEWSVGFLRSRRGGSTVRVEKWLHRSTGRIHFRTRDGGDIVTVFGARSNAVARIADPNTDERTFAWLPELQIDPHGNAAWFEYSAETVDGVDRSAPWERRDPSLAQRYLKRIRYGNHAPLTLNTQLVDGILPESTRWCFQLVLDYGDHSSVEAPSADPDRTWPARSDAFSTFRNGFEIRTYRLCRRFLSFHEFDELGAAPTLVNALELTHSEHAAGSTLDTVVRRGYRREVASVSSRALPPLRLSYASPASDTSFSAVPVTTRQNVPSGLAHQRYAFVDLHGDGLPGILAESDRVWFYKRNLGGGEFGAQSIVLERPATRAGAFALGDIDRDGDTDLSQLSGRLAGLYELDRESDSWRGFRPFSDFPRVEALGARAQWVDLNGDGRADIIVAKESTLLWFPSDGDAFLPPVEVPRPDTADGPPTLTADAGLEFFFADLTGDGLPDFVRVSNGRVEYWPALGNGHFGDVVVMDGAPRFASDDDFDANRIRFVDLDGSGAADIVYIGHGQVSCWINAAGNQLLPGPVLSGLPYFDNVSTVRVLDFLGDGRACLVWSCPLPGRESAIEYLPLTPAVAPRMLLSVDNSLGVLTRLTYASSAEHYLRDVAAGRGWATRLPNHHPVVNRREVFDLIAGTRSVRHYEYHDGHYDGREREPRGFGQVDVYNADIVAGRTDGADAPGFSAPALTRTWFHLGTPMWDYPRASDVYATDAGIPQLPPHVIDEPSELTADEIEEGLRAFAGQTVRRETYAVAADGTPSASPFEVWQATYRLRRLQPAREDDASAFSSLKVEEVSWTYEQAADDPRVEHQMVVEADDYEMPRRQATIAYPRRPGRPRDVAAQDRYWIEVQDHDIAHFDDDGRYELALSLEARRYELAGLRPGTAGLFTRDQLRAPLVVAALAAPGPNEVSLSDDPTQGPRARRLSWDRSFYWDDTRAGVLDAGKVGAPALVHHEEVACFTPAFVADAFAGRVADADLTAAGYELRDGLWWQVDEMHLFSTASQFSQRLSLRRSDGAATSLAFDKYALVVTSATDRLGNIAKAEIDYHQLAPWRLTDANGNSSEARYDELGVIVTASAYGDIGSQPWGFDPLDAVVPRTALSLTDALAAPESYLQGAARYRWYDLDAWERDGSPTTTLSLQREQLVHDGDGNSPPPGRIQIVVGYLDGRGRRLQEKMLVEAGLAIERDSGGTVVVDGAGRPVLAWCDSRWRASGHVVYDDKERPTRQFEPFFTGSPAYEGDDVLQHFGTATITRYDAVGRSVGQDFADGSFTSIAYNSWSIERADANDNVLASAWGATRANLPASDPQRQAYEEAKPHAGTARSTFLDPFGREVATVERGGSTAVDRYSESRLDVEGRSLEVVDPRGLVAFAQRYDMQGRVVFQHSIDAGDVATFTDARGRQMTSWSARGFVTRRGYDLGDRPLYIDVTGGDGPLPLDHRVEERVYGESLADRADARRRNLLGHVVVIRDGASQTTVDRYDPTGRILSATRQLRANSDSEPDWRKSEPLESDLFATSQRFDGVGRVTRETLADGSMRSYEYQPSSGPTRVRLTTPGGALSDEVILDGITVSARGERLSMTLGNGVVVERGYDPETHRPVRQTSTLGTRKLQDLAYTYDAVGNLTRISDGAQEGSGAVVRGVSVSANRDYRYDAHYRLRQAGGRVHQALLQYDFVPGTGGTVKGTRHLSLNNGAAIERFTRNYDYDVAGNLQSIAHAGTSQSWTTTMWISLSSNRSLPAVDLNGVPITNPESRFDDGGNVRALSHLRGLEWNWRSSLARSVVIARPGGVDDDERYLYDAGGQRVRKRTTRVVHGGISEVTEKVYFGDLERKRVYLDGKPILERFSVRVGDGRQNIAVVHRWSRDDQARETDEIGKSRIHYQLNTHQGSSALELDESGGVISYEEYFPYGGSAFIAGDDVREIERKDYRYCGKECDDFTGLYYYGFRYLAPWMGRWLSPDPIGPRDDLNLYQFVLGDPVGRVDAMGLHSSPGDVVVDNRVPPAAADTVEGRVSAFRQALPKAYREGFSNLTSDQQQKLIGGNGWWLVPKDPRAATGTSGWAVINEADYRNSWLPQRQEWAAQKKEHVVQHEFSENPNATPGGGGSGLQQDKGQHADGGGGHAHTSAKPPTASAHSGDGGDHKGKSKNGGDGHGGGHVAKDRGGDGEHHGAGAHAGKGDAAKADARHRAGHGHGGGVPHGTGSQVSDVYGYQGVHGGRAGGVPGGTPFSPGHTPGARGHSAVDSVLGEGPGSGVSGSKPSQGVSGVGAPGPSEQGRGAVSGLGDTRRPGHGPPGSAPSTDPSTGRDETQGQPNAGPGERTQHGQPPEPYGLKSVLLDIAGITCFVFSENREGGDPGGIPGALGLLNLKGSVGQWIFIGASLASFLDLVFNFAAVIEGLINLVGGLFRLVKGLFTRTIPGLLRAGGRALTRWITQALRGAYLSSGVWSSGFLHTEEAILAAFRAAAHTDFSRLVLEALESGRLRFGVDATLDVAGQTRSAAKIVVNNTMELEDVLSALVHEAQHAFDIGNKVVPPPRWANAFQAAVTEFNAWRAGIDFARANKWEGAYLAKFFRLHPQDVLYSILDSYRFPKEGALLIDQLTVFEIGKILAGVFR